MTHQYQWISTEPERHNEDIEVEAIKPTRGIKDAWPPSEREEDRRYTDLLIETARQEEHALNVDKWDTSPETAQGRRRKASISSTTTTTTNRVTSHRPLFREISRLRLYNNLQI